MQDLPDQRRRRFVTCVATAAVGSIAGCSGSSEGNDASGTEDGNGADTTTDGTASSGVDTGPEAVVRKMLRATAEGDRETVRRLTVEGHSLSAVGKVEQLTIESLKRHSAQSYAERAGVSVSAVEDALAKAENQGYDDATIVSYTASTAKYDEIQRDYILVLDGDQWLMYDFGRLPQ